MDLFWKQPLSLPTLTSVSIQSTTLGSAMSLSHSKKKTILSSEPFSDCLNPRNSSLKEDPHSLEH